MLTLATTRKDLEGDVFSFLSHDCHTAYLDHRRSPLTTIVVAFNVLISL